LLSLLAFGWRVAGLASQSLWRDEVDSIRFASRPPAELIATFARPGENGPLFFALLNPWLAALGTSEFSLRLQAVLPGVLAVPLTYVLARRLLAVASQGELRYRSGLALGNAPLLAALLMLSTPAVSEITSVIGTASTDSMTARALLAPPRLVSYFSGR